MTPSITQFRARLLLDDPDDIVSDYILSNGAAHVPTTDIDYIKQRIRTRFGIDPADINVWIVGSAKLGFSLVEKMKNGRVVKDRYRLFSVDSDIDTAVVSRILYEKFWYEIVVYGHSQPFSPYIFGKLSDYMLFGWIRTDYLLAGRRSRAWWDLLGTLSADRRFNRHPVRAGLFYSKTHLHKYLKRSVDECIKIEETNP